MRNLMIVTMAGGGAFFMAQASQGWAATLLQQAGAAGQNPFGALLFLPALIVGGLGGALLGGLVAPLR
jgi:hypothetical protein